MAIHFVCIFQLLFLMFAGCAYALEGMAKWSYHGTYSFHTYQSPAIGHDGTVYITCNWGGLHAINPDGTSKWIFSTALPLQSSPTISPDGTIYFAEDGGLYAVNPDGTKKWYFQTAFVKILSTPTLALDGTIYIGCQDSLLYAINPDGTLKWTLEIGNVLEAAPVIGADGTIYVGTQEGKFHAVNPNGTEKWNFTTGLRIDSSAAIAQDGTIYIGSWNSYFYALNPDGTQKWKFKVERPGGGTSIVSSSPAIDSQGTIYFGTASTGSNKLYALNPDGTLKWMLLIDGQVVSSPAIGANGIIYFGSEKYIGSGWSGLLHAVNANGTQRWIYEAGNRVRSSPAIGSDGTIYFGVEYGPLLAVESISMGLADSPWPMLLKHQYHSGNVSITGPNLAKNYGLFVGSNKTDWKFKPGGYPIRGGDDAQAFYSMISQYMAFSNPNADSVLVQDYYSTENITELVCRINSIKNQMDDNDTFFFYFCGHGSASSWADANEAIIVQPQNAPGPIPDWGNVNGIWDQWLADKLLEFPEGSKKIVILDSCHSGGFWDELQNVPNILFMSSSTTHTFSFGNPFNNHSFYSQELVEALEPKQPGGYVAKADLDENGLTFKEIHDYATAGLKDLFNTFGGQNLPVAGWNPTQGYFPWTSVSNVFFGEDVGIGNRESGNHAPLADGGPDQLHFVSKGQSAEILLDGSESLDAEGDGLTYTWSINTQQFAVGKTPIIHLGRGEYHIQLTVNDGSINSDPDQVIIHIREILAGDTDASGQINLLDAVLALQIAAGLRERSSFPTASDVNGDCQIGVEESIYSLKVVSLLEDPS